MEKGIPRREAIVMIGATGAALAFGCDDPPTSPSDGPTGGGVITTTGSTACAPAPTEVVGPYPSLTDLFRSDIREGKRGTLLMLTSTVVDTNRSCRPVADLSVEIWQCDAAGTYSQYGAQRSENFLRGIQTTNADGQVTFTTIYPGWYQGRATHIPIEVFRAGTSVKVTQIAFPESISDAVYDTSAYRLRGVNPTPNARDTVFADSLNMELATVTGDPRRELTATFRVGVPL